jgi:hypothetical protein
VVYAVATTRGLELTLVRYETSQPPLALGSISGTGGFIDACEAEHAVFIAFGTQTELAIVRVASDGQLRSLLAPAPIALGDVLHPEDAGHDRLRMLCRSSHMTLVAATRERALVAFACDAEQCEQSPPLAQDVAALDATTLGEDTLIAYSRSTQPQLALLRLDAHAQALGASRTPAACWDPPGGMCGQPTLVADGSRLLLCARDGSDLLALESEDGGQAWKPLSGLKVSGAINTDASAPMEQHRKRKGLE